MGTCQGGGSHVEPHATRGDTNTTTTNNNNNNNRGGVIQHHPVCAVMISVTFSHTADLCNFLRCAIDLSSRRSNSAAGTRAATASRAVMSITTLAKRPSANGKTSATSIGVVSCRSMVNRRTCPHCTAVVPACCRCCWQAPRLTSCVCSGRSEQDGMSRLSTGRPSRRSTLLRIAVRCLRS